MEIIAHRRNTAAQLRETPVEFGVEIDLRSRGDRLILHHDPFAQGEDFETWLADYRHGTLILNVKEEGLEDRLLAMMAAAGIERFFFLDQSFPFLVRTARRGEPRCAVRVSEFESVETALTLGGLVRWVWVDCFTRFPLSRADADRLAAAGLQLCLVSPELQGRPAELEVPAMRALLAELGVTPAAVCTKVPALWT
jgi:hypothetical protein